ncbi:putative velvet family sexual development regulator [Psilocybe cubensis]|uniref:Velvet family sexual development regulator n=2 Tax=Psilocybe cubensis TaxID=181762 RepID=A0ACB8GQY5_PSICU|nr:putative velvet family sexual development regulator [Psilocybe cubensis]KAH9477943.1 putative velvet family sexual development regulator [Psilocybe cubensis]
MTSQQNHPLNSSGISYGTHQQDIWAPQSINHTFSAEDDMLRTGIPSQNLSSAPPNREASPIGRPMYLSSGPLAGRTVRMEIQEIQQAELGRRYGKIDRRPIDPPPVVLLRIFEVRNAGTNRQQERELEYDTPLTIGLICTVDLFPVPRPGESSINHTLENPTLSEGTFGFDSPSLMQSSSNDSRIMYGLHHGSDYRADPGVPSHADEVLHYINGYPITERSKQTQALAGNTFVQPILAEYGGRDSLLFVFNDLSVKLEGYFILRYRVFDIYSQEYVGDTTTRSVMSECYGGIFRMYPSKTFPGLPPSTELTKHLARYNGTRVNVRNEERHRRL